MTPPTGAPLFTSRCYLLKNNLLVDPLEANILLHPPIPNQWFFDHHLDITDSNILMEDSDHDGFTNLEEWRGNDPYNTPGSTSTDPKNPNSHPLLWTKLTYSPNDISLTSYRLEFIGYDDDEGIRTFYFQPKTPIPHNTAQGRTLFDTKIRSAHLGKSLQGLPLQLLSFEKKETIHHETPYDTSTITLLDPLTKTEWTLTKKSLLHPNATEINLTEKVILHYLLESPPKEFPLTRGDTFTLEIKNSPSSQKSSHQGTRDSESYKVIEITLQEVILEREGKRYSMPVRDK